MNSGVVLKDKETFDEVMKYSFSEQIESKPAVSEKREEFLSYVYGTWKEK